jgi:arylsulfatase A-like enzyme
LGDGDHAPETQGFDVNVGGTRWGAPTTFFWPYRGSGQFGSEFRYVPGLPLGKPGDYLTDKLTDAALEFIDQAAGRPFFLLLAHHAPHTPIEAPADLIEHFRAKLRPKMKHQHPAYAAMVKSLDGNVGRVLDHLQSRGLAERTIVVFASDNGGFIGRYSSKLSQDSLPSFDVPCTNNAPLRSGKGSLYEGGIRVPLIVRWPGAAPGERTLPTVTTDLFVTLLSAAGAAPVNTQAADGLDLSPLLHDAGAKLNRERLFWHYPHYYATTTPVSAIRAGDWKLLEYFEDGHRELYNLRDDPEEQHDVAAAKAEQAAALARELAQWRTSVGAKLPQSNPQYRGKN